ncbi:Crp/Fnr family transcriptional regulator [Corynebacterium accolens]|uniref:Crp/Fnr family transcriptional regulator n=1 Tax=Corynebacterium accolens TaxID=38284 RepID=UPI00254FF3A9|nr:Crp/Fnr family transcriptional regulator [Corynebacterium accolens]MDK8472756.1 Crp/Fnr family transcriptional regulator [Corynebacterium accolens]MDK8618828.1 Crp/Fnr family transcriptional regulator [Corynebacterium accolens]
MTRPSDHPVRTNCAEPHRCPRDVRLRALAQSRLTGMLEEEQHADLDTYLRAWSWAKGDPLVLAGQKNTGCYILVAGRVRIERAVGDGKTATVDIAVPGDIIGSLLEPVAEESAWAMETTCALHLPGDALSAVVHKYPAISLAIMQLQEEKLALSRQLSLSQSAQTVQARVAGALIHLDEKLGQQRGDGSRLLQVRLRREDLAGLAGTTVESTSRALTKMKKQSLIDSGREWIVVLDYEALLKLAGA